MIGGGPVSGMLELFEDDQYFYDAEAGDRPIRFVEKYLRFYTGKFVGQLFKLEPIQKRIISDIFGWKSRTTGFRRFTDVYWEGAVGAGKSPVLAAIGLYGLIGDKEPGAEVYSFAKSHPQARIVFDTAKRFIKSSKELASRLEVRHAEIRHPASNSFWRIVPGTGPGAGAKPHFSMGDEAHDWRDSVAYDDLHDRMPKRDQPLMFVATNSGQSQASICWKLRERAIKALQGTGDPALYPIIWTAGDVFDAAGDADKAVRTDDPKAWRDGNPLLGITISEEKVAAKCAEMIKDEQEERKFRRLYLSIWPKQAVEKWLNLDLWDRAKPENYSPPADAAVYAGADLSQSDDLSAVVWARITPEMFYIDAHFWMPVSTAERYRKAYALDYFGWADAGHITLVKEPTISDVVKGQIAEMTIARAGKVKLSAVCYDRYKADIYVKTLETKNVPCVPIPQGFSLSPGCNELDRRLKEQTIVIADNPVLRFCAENVEVKRDDRDNVWPVKPGASGEYEGRRPFKIDGIAALVTCLTQARKHVFPAKKSTARVISL